MAKGIAAAFIKRNGEWIGHWLVINEPGVKRQVAMARARDQLTHTMVWPGEAIARRNMVFVDGLCSDGRELVELVAAQLRKPDHD